MADEKEMRMEKADVGLVEALSASLSRSSARSVEATEAVIERSAVLSIDADKVQADLTLAGIVHGKKVKMERSICEIGAASEMKLERSLNMLSVSRGETKIHGGATGIIAASTVKAEAANAIIVIAKNVEGDIRPVMDWKSALAFGAGLGAVLGLFSLMKRR